MSFDDFPFFRASHLRIIDRHGQRDAAWNGAYGLAREALDALGVRCWACGHKLWSTEGTRRIYCDDVCRNRGTARAKRYRKFLRNTGHGCALCNCKP